LIYFLAETKVTKKAGPPRGDSALYFWFGQTFTGHQYFQIHLDCRKVD